MFGLFKTPKELTFEDLDYYERKRAIRKWEDEYKSHLTRRIKNLVNAIRESRDDNRLLQKELDMYKSFIKNLNLHIKEK